MSLLKKQFGSIIYYPLLKSCSKSWSRGRSHLSSYRSEMHSFHAGALKNWQRAFSCALHHLQIVRHFLCGVSGDSICPSGKMGWAGGCHSKHGGNMPSRRAVAFTWILVIKAIIIPIFAASPQQICRFENHFRKCFQRMQLHLLLISSARTRELMEVN